MSLEGATRGLGRLEFVPELPRKTKIICTIGPAICEKLEEAIDCGLDVARLNFSHGDHESHGLEVEQIRKIVAKKKGKHVAILLDTKGPEIRTGFLEGGQAVELTKGQELEIVTDYSVKGTKDRIACSYAKLAQSVNVGSIILAADGSLSMEVVSKAQKSVVVKLLNSGKLGERKNMNLPGIKVDLPTITEKDRKDLVGFGLKYGVDFIAASFVQSADDIDTIREILGKKGKGIQIIAKIENQEGLLNFDAILERADGIMVARGDLGMEIPLSKVFLAQKMMIEKCNAAGKLVVTATQMLESMTKNPRPTRAEASDVANAVLDGSDAVMLSGETAAGGYPVEAISTMAAICREAEASISYPKLFRSTMDSSEGFEKSTHLSPMMSVVSSAIKTSLEAPCKLILALTTTGTAPRLLARYRPEAQIVMLTTDAQLCRQSKLLRGVHSMVYKAPKSKSEEVAYALEKGSTAAKEYGWIKEGDYVLALFSWQFRLYQVLKEPQADSCGILGPVQSWS